MNHPLKKAVSRLGNRSGQVAVFVALIFQVLFLFFAMVINVGLLVHHKINLQNSVDLAAYYGAMRQAEGMNAIAHTNYQIRQSWKLLTWRYRGIGAAGEIDSQGQAQPFLKEKPGNYASGADSDSPAGGKWADFYDAPAFCITYVPFRPMPVDENTCRWQASGTPVKLFRSPAIIAGFIGFSHAVKSATDALISKAVERCKIVGPYNYMMLGKFVVAFNIDQADRMALINKISRSMSEKGDDFTDIEGNSVKDGVKATLEKNLTYANKASYTFDVYNSLGQDGCNAASVSSNAPARWLNRINIMPGFKYIDTDCTREEIQGVQKELVGGQPLPGGTGPQFYYEGILKQEIDSISPFIGPRQDPDNLNNLSLGVEKNPWCMSYVGVKATAKPSIPFTPFGTITLKARAFAKPFGGRVGPWFYKKWPRGYESTGSARSEQTDERVPKRVKDPGQIGDISDRYVNYSRFVGDPNGLASKLVYSRSAKAIYSLDKEWGGDRDEWKQKVKTKEDAYGEAAVDDGNSPNFSHWDHLPYFSGSGGSGDILAWNGSASTPMRALEMASILPDAFDYAYYSIEPDFYNNYYLKLKNGLLAKKGGLDNGATLRPDIGYHAGGGSLETFSVKDQTRFVRSGAGSYPLGPLEIQSKLTYLSLDWRHALTGWADQSLEDYRLDLTRFGKCLFPSDVDSQPALNPPTSGNCASGGTTGYSVKLVSPDYLKKTDLQLGGDNAGTGPLYNPPKDDF